MYSMLGQNWWALTIRGVFAVLFGLLAFFFPGITLTILVLWFGAYALVDGIFAIVAAVKDHTERSRWWALLLEGILGIAVGIITLFWPGITSLSLVFFIGSWAIVTGILAVITAIRLREDISGEWLMVLSGVISVIFGILLVLNPTAGLLSIAWLIGFYALFFGILMLVLSFRLRGWQTAHKPV